MTREADPASRELVTKVRACLEASFAEPRVAHLASDFLDRYTQARTAILADPGVQAAGRRVLVVLGAMPGEVVHDPVRLRAVPSGGHLQPGASDAYKLHRDTWYANPQAQINTWIPVWDVATEECCGFWPERWDVPVPNDSERFDLAQWTATGGFQAAHPDKIYPTVLVDPGPARQFDVEAAGIVQFCGAQLHGPVGHGSGRTRWSLELRSVRLADVGRMERRNVDSRARGSTLGSYRPL